jgi:tetratricopeptide (TPR) repeat protein
MGERYFSHDQFVENFGKEMTSASDVYNLRKKDGVPDYAYATFDFVYISDVKSKLEDLASFLSNNYGFKIRKIEKEKEQWMLAGDATRFPVDEDNLMFWALDLYCKGYQFDCVLDGYGAIEETEILDIDMLEKNYADLYFELATEAYNNQNFGMAIVHFSIAIKINPNDPNSWYSRAIIKDELHTWKAARRDYDKAISIAPDFVDAIVNRGVNKDNAGEFAGAIEDYNKAIDIEPANAMAFFNRGNSKNNINDDKGACEDWEKALALGAEYAQERIDEYCR